MIIITYQLFLASEVSVT